MRASIWDGILHSGCVGPIYPGMSRHALQVALGKPSARTRANTVIWHYGGKLGDLQVTFNAARVRLIGINFHSAKAPVLPRQVLKGCANFPPARSFGAVARILKRRGVEVSLSPLSGRDQTFIEVNTPNGNEVTVAFDGNRRSGRLFRVVVCKAT